MLQTNKKDKETKITSKKERKETREERKVRKHGQLQKENPKRKKQRQKM